MADTRKTARKTTRTDRIFTTILVAAPLLPLTVLFLRDSLYRYFGWPNTETPQASFAAWELYLIAGVCWLTAAAVAVGLRRENRRR